MGRAYRLRCKYLKQEQMEIIAGVLCGSVAKLGETWCDLDRPIHALPDTGSLAFAAHPKAHEEDACVQRICGAIVFAKEVTATLRSASEPVRTTNIDACNAIFWRSDMACHFDAGNDKVVWGVPCGFKVVPPAYEGPPDYAARCVESATEMADACRPLQIHCADKDVAYTLCPWADLAYLLYMQHNKRFAGGRALTEKNDRDRFFATVGDEDNLNACCWTPMLRPNYSPMDAVGTGIAPASLRQMYPGVVLRCLGVARRDPDGAEASRFSAAYPKATPHSHTATHPLVPPLQLLGAPRLGFAQ